MAVWPPSLLQCGHITLGCGFSCFPFGPNILPFLGEGVPFNLFGPNFLPFVGDGLPFFGFGFLFGPLSTPFRGEGLPFNAPTLPFNGEDLPFLCEGLPFRVSDNFLLSQPYNLLDLFPLLPRHIIVAANTSLSLPG